MRRCLSEATHDNLRSNDELVISIVPAIGTGLSEVAIETGLTLPRTDWSQRLRATRTEPDVSGAFVLVLRVNAMLAFLEIQSNGNAGFVRTVPIDPDTRNVIATRRLNSIFGSEFDVFLQSETGEVTWATVVDDPSSSPDAGACEEADGTGTTPWVCAVAMLNVTNVATPFPTGAMLALGGRALLAMGWDTELGQAEVHFDDKTLYERSGVEIDAAPFGDLVPWPASETADRGLVVESSAKADPEILFLEYTFETMTSLTRSVAGRRSIVPRGTTTPSGINSLTSIGGGRFAASSSSGVYLFSESEPEVANVLPTVTARDLVWSGGYLWMILRESPGEPEVFARLPIVMTDRP